MKYTNVLWFFVIMFVGRTQAANMQTAPAFYVENIKKYNAEVSKIPGIEKQIQATLQGPAPEQAARSITELTAIYGNALQTLTDTRTAYATAQRRTNAKVMGLVHTAVQNIPDVTSNMPVGSPQAWFARQDTFLANLLQKINQFNSTVLKQQDAAAVRLQSDVQKSEQTLTHTLAQLGEQAKAAAASSATAESLKKTLELLSTALEKSEEEVGELAQEIRELTAENEGLREIAHSVVTQGEMRSRSSSISSSGSESEFEEEPFAKPEQIQRPTSPLRLVGEQTLAQCQTQNDQLRAENKECAQSLLRNVQAQKELMKVPQELIAKNASLQAEVAQLKGQAAMTSPQMVDYFKALKQIFVAAQKDNSLGQTRQEVVNEYTRLTQAYKPLATVLKDVSPVAVAEKQNVQPGGLRGQRNAMRQEMLQGERETSLQKKIDVLTQALKKIFEKAGPSQDFQATRGAVAMEYQDLVDKGFAEFVLPEDEAPFSHKQYGTLG